MLSTVVGDYYGRVYVRDNVLQHNHADDTLSIFKAKSQFLIHVARRSIKVTNTHGNKRRSGTESFVLKRVVSRPFYD